MEHSFTGFPLPKQNWTKLPNVLIEALCEISTVAELKVILYILRHTWGFQEFEDWDAKCIRIDEFMHGRKRRDRTRLDTGLGLSAPSVYKGIERAIGHGFLVKYVDNTDLGRVTHYYRLRMQDEAGPSIVYAMDPKRKGENPWHMLSSEVKAEVYNRSQGRCAYCDGKVRKWHYDHIIPRSRDGSDDAENIALACPPCNLSKNDRTPEEWGHLPHYYEGDVKKVYMVGETKFTWSCKEVLPRTEKDTVERNSRKNAQTSPLAGNSEPQNNATFIAELEQGQAALPDRPAERTEQELRAGTAAASQAGKDRVRDEPWRVWGVDSRELRASGGVSEENVQRIGWLLADKFALAPIWANRGRVKQWMAGCAELWQVAGGDLAVIEQAGRELRQGSMRLSGPWSFVNTVRGLVAERASGNEGQARQFHEGHWDEKIR